MNIEISSINDDLSDFQRLFSVFKQLNYCDQSGLDICLDLTRCNFLRQNAVAFLGGVIHLIKAKKGRVSIKDAPPPVMQNLRKNDFLRACGFNLGPRDVSYPYQGNTIPFRQDTGIARERLVSYIQNDWIGRGWVHVSPLLRDFIAGKVWEIYDNAFSHSESPIGVFSCGQFYPQMKKLKLTVVDFGLGIPFQVRRFHRNVYLSSSETLKWAFVSGNTTTIGISRGLGLNILKEFIQINQGDLQIFSDRGYALINKNGEFYRDWNHYFPGTLFNITLECDESYYCFSSELNDDSSGFFF